jgi:transmembrane sensor
MSLLSRWLSRNKDPVSRWFAEIRSGNINEREDRQFTQWLQSDSGNEGRLENCDLAWNLAGELAERPEIARLIEQAAREVDATRTVPPSGSRRVSGSGRPAGWWVFRPRRLAAAAVALAAFAGISIWFSIADRSTTAEYATRIGEQRAVTLEDGSTVTLNTATHLQVRYSRKWRSVELISGEALFAVHPDSSRPFSVLALGGVTTAVGTVFAVELRAGSAAVSVLEGTVTVAPSVSVPSRQPLRVTVGQAVDYNQTGASGAVYGANAQRIRAWQSNRILFANERLADAIEEYNRYCTTPLVLEAPALADRRVDGLFRIGDQEAFIHALERALPLRDERTGDSVRLIPR